MTIRPALRVIALVAATFTAHTASAHSFWLQPVDHAPDEGEELRVDFKVGHPGEVNDWGLYWERIASLRTFGPDGAHDEQTSVRTTNAGQAGRAGEAGGAVVTARGPGTYVLAFASNPSFSEFEAERFNAYLGKEGLAAIAAHREAQGLTGVAGTELYARRAKTILQVGTRQTRNATEPIGHILEIVPTQNPLSMGEGEQLPMKVLWRGRPLAGAKLIATPIDESSASASYTTGAHGEVTIPSQYGKAVLYTVTWGEPAPNDARADYFTIFASLTVASGAMDF